MKLNARQMKIKRQQEERENRFWDKDFVDRELEAKHGEKEY